MDALSPTTIEKMRLRSLRELYVCDEITLDQLAEQAEVVLRGEQPDLPIADPALIEVVWL